MCKLSGKLVLCTCNEQIDKTKPNWILNRRFGSKFRLVVGEFDIPYLVYEHLQKNVEAQLNQANCFDFDYIPCEGDTLILDFNDFQLTFVFNALKQVWFSDEHPELHYEYQVLESGYIGQHVEQA